MLMRFVTAVPKAVAYVVLCVGCANAQPPQKESVVISDTIAELFELPEKTLGGQSDSLSLIGLPTGVSRYRFVESPRVNQLLGSYSVVAKDCSNSLIHDVHTSPLPLVGKGGDRSKPLFMGAV